MLGRINVELLKEFDSQSLTKLAGLVHDLQLEFGPAEGFQTAFRMLIQQAEERASRRMLPSKHMPSSSKKRSHEQQNSVAADNEPRYHPRRMMLYMKCKTKHSCPRMQPRPLPQPHFS
ncbi:TPA: hypothetical protein ACH3X1_005005 [Trebouxia sp. C0004]